MTDLFYRAALTGFAVAAPVGPIGLLILRRSIIDGKWAGFVTGLGAATADGLCGAAAAFSLATLLNLVDAHFRAIQIVGGLILVVFGWAALRSKPAENTAKRPLHERNLWVAYATTILLTLANPMTVLGMLAICAATGVGQSSSLADATTFVTGVFLGSTVWWLILSFSAAWLGQRLAPGNLVFINRISGGLVIAFGLFEIFKG